MNTKVIQSTRMCKELLFNGFRIIDIAPNKTDKNRTVFIFELTSELSDYLSNREGGIKEDAKNYTNQTIQEKERDTGRRNI